jgi:hypothetical protein
MASVVSRYVHKFKHKRAVPKPNNDLGYARISRYPNSTVFTPCTVYVTGLKFTTFI